MKQTDIDKRIKELTEEARALEEQREVLAALDVCHKDGHNAILQEVQSEFGQAEGAFLQCRVCTAVAIIALDHLKYPNSDGEWTFGRGSLRGTKVTDIYEVENTEPVESADPFHSEPEATDSNIKEDTPLSMNVEDETDTKGFYRVRFGEDLT